MQNNTVPCWKCSKDIDVPIGALPFKSICDNCHTWQHACINCQFYQIGKPNDCLIPNTESISDREKYNFCDEFSLKKLSTFEKNQSSKSDVAKRLFGDDDDKEIPPSSAEDRFNALFDD